MPIYSDILVFHEDNNSLCEFPCITSLDLHNRKSTPDREEGGLRDRETEQRCVYAIHPKNKRSINAPKKKEFVTLK